MIKIAFYKAQKGQWFGNVITGWTSLFAWKTPPYSHCEIGIPVDGKYMWFSSASKKTNGRTGTRWIAESVLFEHPERWDVYEVANYRSPSAMVSTCLAENRKSYDWPGIVGFALPFGQLNLKSQWYCSEICYYVFFGSWKKRISPKGFYKKIKRYIKPC